MEPFKALRAADRAKGKGINLKQESRPLGTDNFMPEAFDQTKLALRTFASELIRTKGKQVSSKTTAIRFYSMNSLNFDYRETDLHPFRNMQLALELLQRLLLIKSRGYSFSILIQIHYKAPLSIGHRYISYRY